MMRRIDRVLEAERPALERWYATTYVDVADRFALEALEDLARGRVRKAVYDEDFTETLIDFLGGAVQAEAIRDRWQERVTQYLEREAGTKIRQVTRTQRDLIRHELSVGVQAGEGTDALADRIDGLYGREIIPHRAEVIARTEVVSASNLGNHEGARAAGEVVGLKLEKRWSALHDTRVRSAHALHDAKDLWVPIDAPHQVSFQGRVEELQFPGDTSLGASAGNTIQCRCTQTFREATR